MFPSMEHVKCINSGGWVEMGASFDDEGAKGILFKGSIILTRINFDGLALSLIEAKR